MKRGTIATLASLAVLATVGPIVGADQQQEHVKTFSDRYLTSLEEADTVAMTGNNNADAIIVDDTRNGHRRLSWWSLVLMALHCNPENEQNCHLPHPPPRPTHSSSTADISNYHSDSNSNNANENNGEDYASEKMEVTANSAPGIALIAAAAAAAAALIALAVAAKRRKKAKYHQLHGSVGKRMKLFGGFSNSCSETRATSGVQNVSYEKEMQVV